MPLLLESRLIAVSFIHSLVGQSMFFCRDLISVICSYRRATNTGFKWLIIDVQVLPQAVTEPVKL